MGGKTKFRLEKPAVNISRLTGGRNENAGPGTLHEKKKLYVFFYRKHQMEIKITEYVMCQEEAF